MAGLRLETEGGRIVSRAMYRYQIGLDGPEEIGLTGDPVAFAALGYGSGIEFWAEHDDAKPAVVRTFVIVGTGHRIPEGAVYVGTVPRTPRGAGLAPDGTTGGNDAVSIHQLAYRCWELSDPADDERAPHFEDQADAGIALAELRLADLGTTASVRLLDAPCWVADCDAPGCEERYEDDEAGATHFPDAKTLQEWLPGDGWTAVEPDKAFCWSDSPQDAELPPPTPAQQEVAGQLRLPGVA